MIKKGCLWIICIICFLGILSIAIPKLFIRDTYIISKSERFCILYQAGMGFDSPIGNLLIMSFTIDGRVDDQTVIVTARTFWGRKYALLAVSCSQERTRTIWSKSSGTNFLGTK